MINRNYPSNEGVNKILEKLDQLNYFKYVDKQSLERTKQKLSESLKQGELHAYDNIEQNDYQSLEKRIYGADGQDLYDGFMHKVILNMKEVLSKVGLSIITASDEYSDDDLSHYLIINDKKYEVYRIDEKNDSYQGETYYWTLATKRLLEIINQLLENTDSKERLYYLLSGYGGMVILLTRELFEYIITLPLDPLWIPIKQEEITPYASGDIFKKLIS